VLITDSCPCNRSIAEAAATVLGAENFSLKSKGKKAKKAKFKSLAEGSLLTAAETEEAIEEYSSDPSYRDSHSDQSHLPHRDPSQRKRMAPKLLEEELLAERHLKKLRREQSKEREVSMEKVVLLGISFVPQSSESLMSFEGFLGVQKLELSIRTSMWSMRSFLLVLTLSNYQKS
jgi:hypothetical protein